MKKLQDKGFSAIGNLRCDHIIDKCQHGRYESINHLFADITISDGDDWEVELDEDLPRIKEMKNECKRLVEGGILGQLVPKEMRQ